MKPHTITDLWISNSFSMAPKIKPIHNDNLNWMSQLINQSSKRWNIDALRSIFEDDEVHNILQIPLPFFHGDESLFVILKSMKAIQSAQATTLRDAYIILEVQMV